MDPLCYPDGRWSYEEETLLGTRGREPFQHRDRAPLRKIAEPTPTPLARR